MLLINSDDLAIIYSMFLNAYAQYNWSFNQHQIPQPVQLHSFLWSNRRSIFVLTKIRLCSKVQFLVTFVRFFYQRFTLGYYFIPFYMLFYIEVLCSLADIILLLSYIFGCACIVMIVHREIHLPGVAAHSTKIFSNEVMDTIFQLSFFIQSMVNDLEKLELVLLAAIYF